MVNKKCNSCKQDLPIQNFAQSEFTSDGHVDSCTTCRQRKSRETGKAVRSWAKENPKKHAENTRIYAIKSRMSSEAKFDSTITMEALYHRDQGICQICKFAVVRQGAAIDHIHPLSKGGSHTWDNVQLTHKTCNSKKRTQ